MGSLFILCMVDLEMIIDGYNIAEIYVTLHSPSLEP